MLAENGLKQSGSYVSAARLVLTDWVRSANGTKADNNRVFMDYARSFPAGGQESFGVTIFFGGLRN